MRTTSRRLSLFLGLVTGALVVVAGCGSTSSTNAGGGDGGTKDVNPTGCPSSLPSNGASCTSEGVQCAFSCASGDPGSATCTQGAWQVVPSGAHCGDGGPPPADGPFACGAETCGATQFCEHPCCGGPGPACEPMPDSGTCPPGTHSATCNTGGVSGTNCETDPCKPAPPRCVDDPSEAPNCTPNGHDLACICA